MGFMSLTIRLQVSCTWYSRAFSTTRYIYSDRERGVCSHRKTGVTSWLEKCTTKMVFSWVHQRVSNILVLQNPSHLSRHSFTTYKKLWPQRLHQYHGSEVSTTSHTTSAFHHHPNHKKMYHCVRYLISVCSTTSYNPSGVSRAWFRNVTTQTARCSVPLVEGLAGHDLYLEECSCSIVFNLYHWRMLQSFSMCSSVKDCVSTVDILTRKDCQAIVSKHMNQSVHY